MTTVDSHGAPGHPQSEAWIKMAHMLLFIGFMNHQGFDEHRCYCENNRCLLLFHVLMVSTGQENYMVFLHAVQQVKNQLNMSKEAQ